MNIQQRFLAGIVSGAGSIVVKVALNVLLVPVMIHFLGVEIYGLYVLLLGLGELSFILDMGFTAAIVKALGASRTAGHSEESQSYLKIGQGLYSILALLSLTIGIGLTPLCLHLFHISPLFVETARLAFILVVIECALSLYTAYYRAILTAHCLHQWSNIGDTLFVVLSSLAGLAFLFTGHGLVPIFAVRLVASLMRSILLVIQVTKVEPKALFPKATLKLSTLKEISRLSFHSFVVNCSVFVSHKIDNFVIGLFLSLRMVGYYEIVFRFLSIAQQTSSKICEGVFPVYTRMLSLNQSEQVRYFFLGMSNFCNFVVSALLLLTVYYYPELFQLFSAGKIPIQATLPVLAIAVPCVWSGVLQIPAGYYLFVSGKQRYLSVSSVLAALANLILSLILVCRFGIIGVALGTFIPQLIQHQLSLILETCRDLKISVGDYIGTVHLPVIWPLTAIILVLKVSSLLLVSMPLLLRISLPVPFALFAGSIVWLLFSTGPQERAWLQEKISKIRFTPPALVRLLASPTIAPSPAMLERGLMGVKE
jgi:O-antigen/teichoic acid export membrane protein